MSRAPVPRRVVAPSAGARALLVAARAVLLEEVGPLMTPAGRANVLLAVQRGQPVTITINLNAPPSLAVKVAGEIVAALVFEDTPT